MILPIHSFPNPPTHHTPNSPFVTLLIVLFPLLVRLAAMVTRTLQSWHAVFPVPYVSGLTDTPRDTVVTGGRQTGWGRSHVLTGERTQRGAVGEDLRLLADVGDFHFGCVGDLGTIPNSILTSTVNKWRSFGLKDDFHTCTFPNSILISTVNRNKLVLVKSMSSHMHTIWHYILGILKMRDCQSTNYKSTMRILHF